MLRALRETEIDGVATTIPADIAILEHPDFIAVEHSTNWVEQRLDLSGVAAPGPAPGAEGDRSARVQRDVDVEVDGRRYQVKLWVPDVAPRCAAGGARHGARSRPGPGRRPRRRRCAGSGRSPCPCRAPSSRSWSRVGDQVEAGQAVCVLEAMKMENNIIAETAGTSRRSG